MYLEHFGLNAQPFKITPVTDFFFPGANRAEILEALLYSITESEGIIKVTGEVGSGKTMLCRMLLERFPEHIEAVYLANPSLTREEMLYAIADGLNLDLEGQRVNVILQTLQNHLEQKHAEGKQVVILVDEAHAMPLETMEELRLLYNLQVGNHKLLHIMLFGQPELNVKLSQPNMRQLKDRIIHHFTMLPLSQNIIESYLLFRMRTAGYRGPSPFSPAAAALIGKSSQGLMRRVNILADKSLLAAFVENTHGVELRHVQAAIRDTEPASGTQGRWQQKIPATAAISAALIALLLAAGGWYLGSLSSASSTQLPPKTTDRPAAMPATAPTLPPTISGIPATQVMPAPAPALPAHSTPVPQVTHNVPKPTATASHATPAEPEIVLFKQRLEKTELLLSKLSSGSASIQLFYTNDVRPARLEKFLQQANTLGRLDKIYLLPIKLNGRKGLRALYGIYPDSEAARAAIKSLPRQYLDIYAPAIYLLDASPAL